MLRTISAVLATTCCFLLAGCHSNGGYLSLDPALAYGPGVVEFPDPVRVYVPAAGGAHMARHAAGPAEWTPREYEVIYIEDVTDLPGPPPPPPVYPGGAEFGAPAHETPAKYGRRVRRVPGQPLGVEFTD